MLLLNFIYLAFLGSTKEQISLFLHNDMWQLEVLIKFNDPANHSNMNTYWWDDIKLFIIYDADLESMQGKCCFKHCLHRTDNL